MVTTAIDSTAKGANASTFSLASNTYNVPSQVTDAPAGDSEFTWTNNRWSQQLGYYKTIPEPKMAIDAKALWTVGKGFVSNPLTTLVLGTIKGVGVDTFNSILENLARVYNIGGDAYAEIVRDEDGLLINLKPLDPGSITIVTNKKGIIIRYEQWSKGSKIKEFTPEQIFHLSRNRVADEIHGVSIIDCVEWIILARNEAMADYKRLLHRNIYPVRIWHLDTDVPSQIATFKAKVAQSKGEGEDIFIPKDAVETELVSVPENSSLNPMPWIRELNGYFWQGLGVPQIIIGGSQELTQTAAQIAYLAFEQVIEQEQLYIEEQVLAQLNLEIELSFPASLQNNMLSDIEKDGTQDQQQNQPSILQPPMERGEL